MPEQPPLPTSAAKSTDSASFRSPGPQVAGLKVGGRVRTTFLLARCDLRTRQGGEPYLAIELADRTGRVSGRMWERAERAAREVSAGDYVAVDGVVETWQSALQVKVDRIVRADPGTVDPRDFLPTSEHDPDAMYEELLEVIGTVRNEHLRRLLEATFADPEVARRFRLAPAGIKLHHAYLGGLLEHTLSVARLADRVADHYPALDRDLLVAGACLHDLGKIWELSYDRAFDYTEQGRLVGHLLLETEWISNLIDTLEGFPAGLREHLLHLLASHHGTHEHGAPVTPVTPEALALHYVDDLDSKAAAMRSAIAEAESMGAATAYSPSLGRRVLRRRWDQGEN